MSPLAVMCDKVFIAPLALMSPVTCNSFVGAVVPIPTFLSSVMNKDELISYQGKLLLALSEKPIE